jgi:hypothetical protein
MTIQDKLPRFLVKPYAFVYGVLDTIVRSPFTAIEKGFESVALAEPEPENNGRPDGGRHYVQVTGNPRPGYEITGRIYMSKEQYEQASREMGIKQGQTLTLEQTREFMTRYGDAEAVKAWDDAMNPNGEEEYRAVIASGGPHPTTVEKLPHPSPFGRPEPKTITTSRGNSWQEIPEGVLRKVPYLILDGDPERKLPVPGWLIEKLGYQPGESINKLQMLVVGLAVLEERGHYASDEDFAENRNRRLAA